ncbi:frizzled-4-like [Patiria miniata]|uniref:FZ domain-containing protein n=1 Tax=Patiria miniata TaxID=46514 RepID=A0A914B6H1_PATMI|nr:frizzled-4-like [Patiria miniata]
MKAFVCAAFLPACNENGDAIPPCRNLCLVTKANCQVSMEDLGLEWPSELDCDVFPTSDENPHCISGPAEDGLPLRVVIHED